MEQSDRLWNLDYKRLSNSSATDSFPVPVRDDAKPADHRERGFGRIC